VHGRYKQPCPVCGSPVQRIRYADNEANYCATCRPAAACSPTAPCHAS
jgi:formamidopyrimidine-DNA glycosylase